MAFCSIRNNMRKLRFNRGEMTQQELAKNIGVSRQTIIAIEARKYSPTLELAFKIAGVFQVPLEEIFQYEPEKS
ncbi:MAG: helix-turn-helix transcriptional regulator [Candidatus Marinimicrobia bacterium]|nr:helix-turn-helix transcriptional regulator [FCB group bacterium]MBL7024910.1 helix-turn-helix transcriptional regulator [Candidatus Neomarinimicrobiota bacterium]